MNGWLEDPIIQKGWKVAEMFCPACKRRVLSLIETNSNDAYEISARYIVPATIARTPLPKDVPAEYSADYLEACAVLPYSEKASAALSRRCLQHLLRTRAKVEPADLANEIQEVLDSKQLPSQLADAIDAVRHIGNFAAHPIKSKSTGEIVDVELGEAEWSLDTIEGLFDFYFVQPAMLKKKRDELNKKLAAAGKPQVK
ncbi:MAG TPA: DUF4145 domain-containing protein [Bryobacteraceae bacterium]|nr:DUF4145 domain-containing protein [Bryobacteraceae bacterium]